MGFIHYLIFAILYIKSHWALSADAYIDISSQKLLILSSLSGLGKCRSSFQFW